MTDRYEYDDSAELRDAYLDAKARVAHDAIAAIMHATGQTFAEVAADIADMAELGMLPEVVA